MRSLYLTEYWPWPTTTGGRLRAAATVRALAALGSVDVVHTDRGWRHPVPDEPSPLMTESVSLLADGHAADRGHDYPVELTEIVGAYDAGLRGWLRDRAYDVVWCNRISTWIHLRGQAPFPCVVDIDDLQDRLAHGEDASRRWRRLHRAAAAEADWLVVCSDLDHGRLGAANSSVVPNVYLGDDRSPGGPPDAKGSGEPPPDEPGPVILLQGLFIYPPNVDAAERLVGEILPRVQREFPTARVWLVGLDFGTLDRLAREDVRVFGLVPDVRPYVRAADVVAVPLRRGSGTRLKLLESFALGTPVVSSTLGAEGLAARHDEHLLIADEPDAFAEAVATVLRSPASRDRLTANARALVRGDYGWTTLVSSVEHAVGRAREAFGRRGA
ncbi:glycosyltransferase family 4 protein [Streptomyces sp. 4N509B]|uniref:glycosyltransferase family 4 protein n=1 Tax=Streptomyces sp. 4N509B TaxID=3457413 RepID=UPI003FD14F97